MIIKLPTAVIDGKTVTFGKFTGVPDFSKNARNRLTKDEVLGIRESFKNGSSTTDIASKFGISKSHVLTIATGRYGSGKSSKKLTNGDIEQIRDMDGKHTRFEIAQMFGVGTPYVSEIINNKVRVK